jgi:hypothetical protein
MLWSKPVVGRCCVSVGDESIRHCFQVSSVNKSQAPVINYPGFVSSGSGSVHSGIKATMYIDPTGTYKHKHKHQHSLTKAYTHRSRCRDIL